MQSRLTFCQDTWDPEKLRVVLIFIPETLLNPAFRGPASLYYREIRIGTGMIVCDVRSEALRQIPVKEMSLAPPLFLQTIEDTGFSTWLRESESPFAFYFILLFHTFGLALLVGANVVVDLRLLGVAPGIPLAPLRRLFRIMWIGFSINAITGVFLVIAYPTKSLTNWDFYIKLAVIGFAVWVMQRLKTEVFGDASLSEADRMAKRRGVGEMVTRTMVRSDCRGPLAGIHIQVSDVSVVKGFLKGP